MNLKNYLKESEKPSLDAFQKLVANHDITYSFSDDNRVWKRGRESMDKIHQMFQDLVKEDPANEEKCIKIWNDNIDKNLTGNRDEWYWKTK